MTKITYVSAEGESTTVNAVEGDNLMHTAVVNDIDGIIGECGGSMMCATCHVYVEEPFLDKLPPRTDGEDEMLECAASERRPNSRLSCQIKVSAEIEGMVLHMPDSQE